MVPAYVPGDHVLAFGGSTYKSGDVVVLKSDGRIFIKRVKKIVDGKYLVGGDNISWSVKDLITTGKQILGKVIFKY